MTSPFREKVGKKGVVRDPEVHVEVIENVLQIALDAGFAVLGLSWSPIRGPEGNIEYLMYLRRLPEKTTDNKVTAEEIRELVRKSHETL